MKQFIINEDLANAIASYLANRPYREVSQILAALLQLQALEDREEV